MAECGMELLSERIRFIWMIMRSFTSGDRRAQAGEILSPGPRHDDVAVVIVVHPGFKQAGDLVAPILRHEGPEAAIELRTRRRDHGDDVTGECRELARESRADRDPALDARLRRAERKIALREVPWQARHRARAGVRLDAERGDAFSVGKSGGESFLRQ